MLDLFSGIGGFALAAEWRWGEELEIAGFCEIEKYAQKVLKKNFPGVPIYEDITKLKGDQFENIDLITGGFPCQDISIAGKGKGLIDEETGERTRSGLWSEMHRIISEVRPRFAIIENVPMLIHRGFERVLCDLAEIGMHCEWQIIGADEVGAWHRRKRIWIVAYFSNTNNSRHMDRQTQEQPTEGRLNALCESESGSTHERDVPDTDIKRSQGLVERSQKGRGYEQPIRFRSRARQRSWWNAEPDVGRVANGIPNRVDRLRGLGNAIVPQVAYEIMKRIK